MHAKKKAKKAAYTNRSAKRMTKKQLGAAKTVRKLRTKARPASKQRTSKPKAEPKLPADLAAHRGGVSPRMHQPAIRGVRARKGKGKKQPGKFPNFVWHGGPVIVHPEVHTSFWGSLWNDATHHARAQRLNQYHRDLLASGFMNVLSQYGVGQGPGKAGTFVGESFISSVPTTLTDPIIRRTIQSAIDGGVLPEPDDTPSIALMIYLDENIGINDPADQLVLCEPRNDNAFGYHDFFKTKAGHNFHYAVIPALSDACLQNSCPSGDNGCSLRLTQTQEQRQTQVASHEFAEMVTDPELNGWTDPQNGENGDICNGESSTITVGANTWTVQRTYSKTDDIATNGKQFCRESAPAPILPLKPGP